MEGGQAYLPDGSGPVEEEAEAASSEYSFKKFGSEEKRWLKLKLKEKIGSRKIFMSRRGKQVCLQAERKRPQEAGDCTTNTFSPETMVPESGTACTEKEQTKQRRGEIITEKKQDWKGLRKLAGVHRGLENYFL
jgi:hypothetical protein